MKSLLSPVVTLLTALSLTLLPLSTHSATSDPVGAMTVTALNNSDTIVSLPFHKAAVFQGSVVSSTQDTISFTASSFSDNSLVGHYLLLTSGALEGFVADISANTSSTITCTGAIEDLSGLVPNTTFQVIPYTTIGDFIGTDAPNNLFVFLYDSGVGQNLAPSSILRHFNGFGWYSGATPASDVPLSPSASFVIRNQSGSDFELTLYGSVLMSSHRAYVATEAPNTTQDNRMAVSTPVDIPLSEANLGFNNGDFLFLYNNSVVGINKGPSRILRFFEGFGWYDGTVRVDDPTSPSNLAYLKAGEGFVYRKAADATPSYYEWAFQPSYLLD
jgi:uncharacterized protein (TIGR02597 family)